MAILLPIYLFGNTTYHLEGTIGKTPICMQLEDYGDGDLMGRYYYKTSLKDIVIRGERNAESFKFTVQGSYDDITETFVLKKTGSNFNGTWTNKKGKKLTVALTPINEVNYTSPYAGLKIVKALKYEEPYEYVRACLVKLERDTIILFKDKSFVWFSEKHCSAEFFRLGNGFTKNQATILNPILDEIHFEMILSQLSCASDWNYSDGNGIDYTTNLGYLDENLLGFDVFSSWFCGGAHPDFGRTGYLFDLNNGESYTLTDIYNLEDNGIFEVVNNEYKFTKPESEDDYCDYTDENYWTYAGWAIAEKGINFTPSFFRAARACEDSFFVPFSKLNSYKKGDFPYNLK